MLPRDDKAAFDIRANAGAGPDCDINPIEPSQPTTPLPPDAPCDAPVIPDEETFFKPPAAPTPQRNTQLPAPLRVHSPAVNLNCPPGVTAQVPPTPPDTFDYSSPYNASSRSFNLADIEVSGEPLFTSSMLTSLNGVAGQIQDVITGDVNGFLNQDAPSSDPERTTYINSGLPARIAEVMQITKLPSGVIEELWSYILGQQAILDVEVLDRGQRALRCGFFNQDLWVICYDFETGNYTFETADPEDPNAVFIPSGTTFSLTSQADANALALLTVTDVPACLFSNEPVATSCADLFGGDYRPTVMFAWPRSDSPLINIDTIGGEISIEPSGGVSIIKHGEFFLTYSEVLANGTEAQTRELINRVSVASGAVTGRTQEEANAKALALAITYLDCFIPSREKELKCTDAVVSPAAHAQAGGEEATETTIREVLSEIVTGYTTLFEQLNTGANLRPDNITFLPGPAIDERVAVRLFVPAGAFVGDSHIAAESAAEGYTLAAIATKMDCDWRNRAVTYACDDAADYEDPEFHLTDTDYVTFVTAAVAVTYLGPYEIERKVGQMTIVPYPPYSLQGGGDIEMMASVENSAPYTVTSERGLFASQLGQAEADGIAAANAMSQLECVYCNPVIPANCPPVEGEESYDTTSGAPGVLYYFDEDENRWRIVPAPDEHIPPYTHHSEHAEGLVPLSYDIEPFICGDPNVVIAVAGESGRTPTRLLTVTPDCRQCNDFLTAACCSDDTEVISLFSPEQCLDLIQDYGALNSDDGCAGGGAMSNPQGTVSIPECTVFAATKAEANELAANIIISTLNCFFVNDEVVDECVDNSSASVGDSFSVFVNGNMHEGFCQECESSSNTEVVVDRGLFRSNCSKSQANEQAAALAAAQLFCVYTNNEQTAECPSPQGDDHYHPSAILSATVEAGAVVSTEGCCAADEVALRTAALQLYCVFGNVRMEKPCVLRSRPRILRETDNCGCVHTFPCGIAVGGEDEPYGEVPPPVVVEKDVIISPVSTEAANIIAAGLLFPPRCTWVNLPINVACCDQAGNIPADDAVLEVSIEQGVTEGETMCDATEQAFRMAVVQLFCEYTNAEQTANCGRDEGDHFHPDAVISATIAANTIRGCQSTAKHNIIAMGMAMAQLDCLYGNDYQEGGCAISSNPRTLTEADNCGGKHTEICKGEAMDAFEVPFIAEDFVASPKSTAAANALARALLDIKPCVWFNNEVTVTCENKGRRHPSAVLTVTIPQGTITAETMCDATEQAFKTAVSQLQCLWTNEEQIFDECPYDMELVEAGVVEADTLIQCSTALANEIAMSMARAQIVCKPKMYGNAMATSTKCPGDELPVEERRWELELGGFVGANTIQTNNQEVSDAIAEALALSRTICKPIYNCNPETAYGDITKCPLKDPDNPQGDRDVCHREFVGSEQVCAYGFLDSEVQAIAQMIADAATYCCPKIYYNPTEATGPTTCDNDTEPCELGKIEAEAIWSMKSEEHAQELAQKLADAKTFCCPKTYFNTAVQGNKDCSYGICVQGAVPANKIPSWVSVRDATAIAKGIADTLTVCCLPPGEGGGNLPECADNSLIYYGGEEVGWVCLPPYTGSNVGVLESSGGAPSWTDYKKIPVDICENGTPTAYTILGIPTV